MAVFQFNNFTIPYQIQHAPFSHDLLLLQSERFTPEFWRDVLQDLQSESPLGGRVLTCEWPLKDAKDDQQAEFIYRLLQTLGMHALHVVAFDEAVGLAEAITRKHKDCFVKTLFYPKGGPKGEDLVRAVRMFCGLPG